MRPPGRHTRASSAAARVPGYGAGDFLRAFRFDDGTAALARRAAHRIGWG